MFENVLLLVSSTAGSGKACKISEKVEQKLIDANIPYQFYLQDWPDHVEGYTRIFLIGGDGTLNFFINKYRAVRVPVVLFKGGTGNDFAWKLYGDKNYDYLFEKAFSNDLIQSDVGICNQRYFINGIGIGFDGSIVKQMQRRSKFTQGHLAYLLGVLKQIAFYREKQIKIVYNDTRIEEDCFMITIANGARYGGGFLVAPNALLDDENFDIVFIKKIAWLKRIFYLPKVERGKHLKLPFVYFDKAGKSTVTSDAFMEAHVDGEYFESKYFEVEIADFKISFVR